LENATGSVKQFSLVGLSSGLRLTVHAPGGARLTLERANEPFQISSMDAGPMHDDPDLAGKAQH
jgi:acyl dehydratase